MDHLSTKTNQDRAIIFVSRVDSNFIISGVMDGHGCYGHSVAEYVRYSVQQRISVFLREQQNIELQCESKTTDASTAKIETTFSAAFISMVNGIDRDIPDRIAFQGGTTLSFVVQFQLDYLFFYQYWRFSIFFGNCCDD